MTNAAATAAPPKKGKLKVLLFSLIGAIVLVGGGIGAGLYAAGAGLMPAHKEAPKEDPNMPKLVLKDPKGESSSSDSKSAPLPIAPDSEKSPDPTKYKATYYSFEQPFTANLRDSSSFVQVGLGASTFYDAKVIDNIKNNELPIRSAVLLAISQQDSFSISTPDGKLKMQKDLKDAINGVLRQREGFGGVDNVYFTSLVIQ